jgi:beta-glucanase (GH16 family)
MHYDHEPDRPVPPYGNARHGSPTSVELRDDYRRPGRPAPNDQEARAPRPDRPRRRDPRFYRTRVDQPALSAPAAFSPEPGRQGSGHPRPGDQEPYGPEPARVRAVGPEAQRTRADQLWPVDRGPGDPRSNRVKPGTQEPDNPRPGGPGNNGPRPGGPKRGGSSRGALLLVGVLGTVLVAALGLVGVRAMQGSSNGTSAANVTPTLLKTSAAPATSASHPAKASATAKAPAKAKAKASPKAVATHSSQAAAPTLLTVPAGWKLTFDPSFSGTQLDTGTWATCYDWAANPSVGCDNNPTAEKEWYIPSQVSVSGGTLNLTAKQETTQGLSSSGAAESYTCRSGMVTSKPGFNFTYGLIQVSAKLPYGPGLWPALWLAATSDQWPPELDIMEHWYSEPQAKVYDHTVGKKYLGGPVSTPGNLSAGFNTYSLLWTKDRVTWYIDGEQVFTTTTDVPQQAMYFIANVADDSTATGACTGTMEIQSVKVWQP